jgi:hypothetical protein
MNLSRIASRLFRQEKREDNAAEEIAAMERLIKEAEEFYVLKDLPAWATLRVKIEGQIANFVSVNRGLNPSNPEHAFWIIYNNGMMKALELFLNVPQGTINTVNEEGFYQRLVELKNRLVRNTNG